MKKYLSGMLSPRVTVMAAFIVLIVGGLAFAIMQSQRNTLTGNSIETTTASLQMSVDGTIFSNSHGGYDFNGVKPGGPAAPAAGYPLYLRNSGDTTLALRMAVISMPTNLGAADLSKINFILTPVSGGASHSFTLQALMNSAQEGSGLALADETLASGVTRQYKLQVSMDNDAVNTAGASLANIDLSFSGTALN